MEKPDDGEEYELVQAEDYSKLTDKEKKALKNYETTFDMPAGTAVLEQLKETTAGIDGFAKMGESKSSDDEADKETLRKLEKKIKK